MPVEHREASRERREEGQVAVLEVADREPVVACAEGEESRVPLHSGSVPAVIGHVMSATAVRIAAAEVGNRGRGHDGTQRIEISLVDLAVNREGIAVVSASVVEVVGVVAEPSEEVVE